MCARLSSKLSGTMLKKRISLNEPETPPSADAPLSEITMISVLSSSPICSSVSSSRPKWWSQWETKPAKTSIIRAYSRRSSADSDAHSGTSGSRGESCASAGRSPSSCWRAKTSSR